jgi:hypothetical protein
MNQNSCQDVSPIRLDAPLPPSLSPPGGERVSALSRRSMAKVLPPLTVLTMLCLGLLAGGCSKKTPPPSSTSWSLDRSEAAAELKAFIAEKQAQAGAAKAEGRDVSVFKPFFAAASRGDWLAVSNAFEDFRKHAGQYEHPESAGKTKIDERLRGTGWQAVLETWGAFEVFANEGDKYMATFGRDVIKSIPPGSIYFGGTDPGRFVITAMCKSHVNADPFFVLTQNALADSTYLEYLRGMYGGKIYIPTAEDSQRCFQDYITDAQTRFQHHQLKPGEQVEMKGDHVQVSGHVAVIEIYGRLAKIIFDKNPDHEFYVEESFPLDWMYPHLTPNGLILKINRQPLSELSEAVVQKDREYWANYLKPIIGDWLNADIPIADIAAFVEKVYLKHDLDGFKGDPRFVRSPDAQKTFSKLRSSVGGVYVWRMKNAANATEQKRMANAADFAFRQALALCPYSPEAVYRYVSLQMSQNRPADALVVVETAIKLSGKDDAAANQFRNVADSLKAAQKKAR